MPNKNYKRGYRVENRAVNELKEFGFDIAVRTAGSHSPMDFVAFNLKNGVIYIGQCKTKKEIVDKENTKKLKSIAKKFDHVYAWNVWPIRSKGLQWEFL